MQEKPRIITNYHWRQLVYAWDVPQNILESDFSHTTDESLFFKYRGQWYTLDDFPRFGSMWTGRKPQWAKGWDAYASDSFFSGIIIKLSEDCESVRVGLVLS